MVTILFRLIVLYICLIPSLTFADPVCSGSGLDYQCESASVCKDDVAAAMAMIESNSGGTVIIPVGSTQSLGCNWSGDSISYAADGSVAVIGSGSDSTVIRGTDLSLAGFFTFNNSQVSYAIPRIIMKNLSLKGRMKSSHSALKFWGAGELVMGGIRLETENSSTAGMMSLKAVRKGVIYKSTFISDDYNASSCNDLQSYGITPATLYSPYPIPTDNCYSSICNCSVGSRAVWRSSSIAAGNTVIARLDRSTDGGANINNAGGSGKGTVQGVYLYIKSADSNPSVDLASFSTSGNSMTTNGAAQNIPVKVGHNWLRAGKDFTAFNIENGQYLGVYLNNCAMAAGVSKADGGTSDSAHWIASGDWIPATDVNFGTPQADNVSLWADIHDSEGDAVACEDEWDSYWKNTTTNRGGGFFDVPQDHTWKPTSDDDEAIFVEDCQFKWYYAANEGNWGSNARVVYRNNRFILPVGLNSACTKNASRITMKPGGNFAHIYNNYFEYYSFTHDTITFNPSTKTISFTPDSSKLWDFRDVFTAGNKIVVSGSANNNGVYTLISVDKTSMVVSESVSNESIGNLINIQLEGIDRSSTMLYISVDALIYNNVFSSSAYTISPIMYKSYSDWVFTPEARPHHQHMWGNHCFNMYNAGGGDAQCNDFGSAKAYQSGAANGWSPLEFNAPEAGDALYGFSEYPYPHPLTKEDPKPDKPSAPSNLRVE